MRWAELPTPAAMERVALVAPTELVRPVLVAVAESGTLELEGSEAPATGAATAVWDRLRRQHPQVVPPMLVREPLDVSMLERDGRLAELAGEAELERVAAGALRRRSVSAWTGWSPVSASAALRERVAHAGGALVPLPRPKGVEPPTLIVAGAVTRAFEPLVEGYATVGYRDVNPALLAGIAYVAMFGAMFGDVGHGLVLVAAGLLLARGWPSALRRLRRLAPFVIGAGVASALFGLAYGELFGPTHVIPVLWLAPLDHPTTLLAVSVAAGACLLALSYLVGSVNRWREGGAAHALVALSGISGGSLYLGLAAAGFGWYRHEGAVAVLGGVVASTGLVLGAVGLYAESPRRAGGAVQAGVGLFDAVVRIGTNTVSFARLAAFGLTHAALGAVVWTATTALWGRGGAWGIAAACVFVVGNAVTFGLEGLVAGIQALRLEYYELFSRIFAVEGRRFEPWRLPVASWTPDTQEVTCSVG